MPYSLNISIFILTVFILQYISMIEDESQTDITQCHYRCHYRARDTQCHYRARDSGQISWWWSVITQWDPCLRISKIVYLGNAAKRHML